MAQHEYGPFHHCWTRKADLMRIYDHYGRPHLVAGECLLDFRRHPVLVPLRTRTGRPFSDLPQCHPARRGGTSIHRDNIRLTKPAVESAPAAG
jgi:hypothetical protein